MRSLTCYILILLVGGAVHATTLLKKDLAALSAEADRIFVGRVLTTEASWSQDERQIFTTVEFEVLDGIRGVAKGQRIALRLLGGTAMVPDGRVLTLGVPGIPTYTVGQSVLLFAMNDPRLYCPIVGWYQGSFTVSRNAVTGREEVFDHEGHPVTGFANNDVTVSKGGEAMGVDRFKNRLLGGFESSSTETAAQTIVAGCPSESGSCEAARPETRKIGAVPIAPSRRAGSSSGDSQVAAGIAILVAGAALVAVSVRKGRKEGTR